MRQVVIYGLADPETGEIRYVGRSVELDRRLRHHCSPSHWIQGDPRSDWIRSLAAIGHKPTMVVLETADAVTWREAEQRWIAHYQQTGRLFNRNVGGEGCTTRQYRTARTQTDPARFASKVRKDGNCWRWIAAKDQDGYGLFYWKGGQHRAARFAYELFIGPIPDGHFLHLLCKNKDCVYPEHWEPRATHAPRDKRPAGWIHPRFRNPDAWMATRRRGEAHPKAKLTAVKAQQIYAMRGGIFRQQDVADLYGVTQPLIGMIWRGELWADATGAHDNDRSADAQCPGPPVARD